MNDIRKDLEAHGVHVTFVVINTAGDELDQSLLIASGQYPMLQDSEQAGAWAEMGGGKDDFFLYDSSGTLVAYLPESATLDMVLSGEAGFSNLRAAAAALK